MRKKSEQNEQLRRRDFLDRTLKFSITGLAYQTCGRLAAAYAVASPAVDKTKPTPLLSCESKKGRWQIGCYTRPWAKYDYRIALDAIAEAGFKYAGLMTTKSKTRLVISVSTTRQEAEQVGQEVKKRGLAILSVWGGNISVAKSLQAGIDELKKLIDNCAACGARSLLMGGTGKKQLYEAYYKAIAECCDYADKMRVAIIIKPHGGLNATGPQCRKAVEMVGHKNFRIWYDPGNILYYSNGELDPVADAATVDGLVTGMCIKDYRHPKNVAVTPGTGEVDFPAVLARLQKGGFTQGPLVVECLKLGDLKQTLTEAKKARLFLEELTTVLLRIAYRKSKIANGESRRELRQAISD
ncbi:MAG: sugar phosphate isomerase/epimerase family protein [Sedimentisphaerales bacterium]